MMPETIVTTETCLDTTTTVTVDATDDTTTTTTVTDNLSTTVNETNSSDDNILHAKCPCGNINLHKLLEQSRCWAFKSTNITAATSNAVLIFAMKILQEILIQQCKDDELDINNVFLITAAIAELAKFIRVYNPQPFNS